MRPTDIVDQLLEAYTPDIKRQFKKLFVPGSKWKRVNYRFPTKISHDESIPAGTWIDVEVLAALSSDSIVFGLPGLSSSYLKFPDPAHLTVEYLDGGVDISDKHGKLLSYRPV